MRHLDAGAEFRSRHFATVVDLHAGLRELVGNSFAEFVTEQAVIVTDDHTLLLKFGKVLHAESFEQFRSRFLVEAHDGGTHHLEVAERKFGTDFTTPARSTKALSPIYNPQNSNCQFGWMNFQQSQNSIQPIPTNSVEYPPKNSQD